MTADVGKRRAPESGVRPGMRRTRDGTRGPDGHAGSADEPRGVVKRGPGAHVPLARLAGASGAPVSRVVR